MSNLKQLRTRIKSIGSTKKITKAMQMVSASKVKKMRLEVTAPNYYESVLNKIISVIISNNDLGDLPELTQKFFHIDTKISAVTKSVLFIVISSERGLCGSFNSTIIKKIKTDINLMANNDFKLIIVGKKAYGALNKQYPDKIIAYYNLVKDNDEVVVAQIRQKVIESVTNGEISKTFLYYNKFINSISCTLQTEQILPIGVMIGRDSEALDYECEGEELIIRLVNLYIQGKAKYALLHSRLSEEQSRMIAMDNATRNANDIIDSLTLKLNRTRQAIITKELIEIISGANAVG